MTHNLIWRRRAEADSLNRLKKAVVQEPGLAKLFCHFCFANIAYQNSFFKLSALALSSLRGASRTADCHLICLQNHGLFESEVTDGDAMNVTHVTVEFFLAEKTTLHCKSFYYYNDSKKLYRVIHTIKCTNSLRTIRRYQSTRLTALLYHVHPNWELSCSAFSC